MYDIPHNEYMLISDHNFKSHGSFKYIFCSCGKENEISSAGIPNTVNFFFKFKVLLNEWMLQEN